MTTAADLRMTKTTPPPDPVIAGSNATSTITVTNDGPSVATNVVITDTIDTGATLVGATVPGGTCASPAGQVVTCTIPTLANGASVTMTVTAAIPPDAAITTLSDLASVTSAVTDPDPSDNTAGASVGVVAEPTSASPRRSTTRTRRPASRSPTR